MVFSARNTRLGTQIPEETLKFQIIALIVKYFKRAIIVKRYRLPVQGLRRSDGSYFIDSLNPEFQRL